MVDQAWMVGAMETQISQISGFRDWGDSETPQWAGKQEMQAEENDRKVYMLEST